jgi:hypothetical protein
MHCLPDGLGAAGGQLAALTSVELNKACYVLIYLTGLEWHDSRAVCSNGWKHETQHCSHCAVLAVCYRLVVVLLALLMVVWRV